MNVRELGKFGQLYLQRGKWKGEQILSEKWIEESTKKQVECGDYNNSQVDGYGYLFWHLKEMHIWRMENMGSIALYFQIKIL